MSSRSRFLSGFGEMPGFKGGSMLAMAALAVRMTCTPFPSPSAVAHRENTPKQVKFVRWLPGMPYSFHRSIRNIRAAKIVLEVKAPTCKEPPSELLFPVRHASSGL